MPKIAVHGVAPKKQSFACKNMFSGLNFLRRIGRFFKSEPIPHDKFDEWPVSASQFIRECHVKTVDRSKLTECDPTCPLVESEDGCVYLLGDQCMIDGLQHIAKNTP